MTTLGSIRLVAVLSSAALLAACGEGFSKSGGIDGEAGTIGADSNSSAGGSSSSSSGGSSNGTSATTGGQVSAAGGANGTSGGAAGGGVGVGVAGNAGVGAGPWLTLGGSTSVVGEPLGGNDTGVPNQNSGGGSGAGNDDHPVSGVGGATGGATGEGGNVGEGGDDSQGGWNGTGSQPGTGPLGGTTGEPSTGGTGGTGGTPKEVGDACEAGAECSSTFCADGVCCETACDGVCSRCDANGSVGTCVATASDAACSPLVCPDPTDCREYTGVNLQDNCAGVGECLGEAECESEDLPQGDPCGSAAEPGECDGAGQCVVEGKSALGESCSTNDDCSSNACVSGPNSSKICCESTCSGACQGCGLDGRCSVTPATDSRCSPVGCPSSTACTTYPADLTTGQCASFGQCRTAATFCTASYKASGTLCGDVMKCDGSGTCTCPSTAPCNSECPCTAGEGACTNDDQCASGLACSTDALVKLGFDGGDASCMPDHCLNDTLDTAQGETSVDCGGECGCRASYEEIPITGTSGLGSIYLLNMSADATAIVGTSWASSTSYAFVVDTDSGALSVLESYGANANASFVNQDGSLIVGTIDCSDPPTCSDGWGIPYYWTGPGSAPVRLPFANEASGISATGNVIVYTYYYDYSPYAAERLIRSTGTSTFTTAMPSASGVSADGLVVWGSPASSARQVVWYTATNQIVGPTWPSDWSSAVIEDMDADGSVFVGRGVVFIDELGHNIPFISRSRGTYELIAEPSTIDGTTPTHVSADGTSFIGNARISTTGATESVIWDDAGGLRRLYDELVDRGLEFPVDAQLIPADAFLSADGRTIIGGATSGTTLWRVVFND